MENPAEKPQTHQRKMQYWKAVIPKERRYKRKDNKTNDVGTFLSTILAYEKT